MGEISVSEGVQARVDVVSEKKEAGDVAIDRAKIKQNEIKDLKDKLGKDPIAIEDLLKKILEYLGI